MRSITTILVTVVAFASQGQQFPTITGETVNGTSITLPTASGKQYTIIGLAYSPKASEALESWLEPAYMRFVAQYGLFAGEYDVDLFFVPVFVGLNRTAYEPTIKKFRKSATPEVEEKVVFSKDDMEPIREALGLKEKDIPYFFVLDRSGKILHRDQGAFTEEKLEAIEEVLMR
jgi:hypothetical protein